MAQAPPKIGALLGLLVTAPLTAVMALVSAATHVRFPPFDLFEWFTRILPGGLVTFGIDALVAVLSALGLSLRATSKTAEQALAVGLFVAGGIVAGLLLATSFRFVRTGDPVRRSVGAAAIVGVLIDVGVPTSTATAGGGRVAAFAWVIAAFASWGGLFGLAWRRLGEMYAERDEMRGTETTHRPPLPRTLRLHATPGGRPPASVRRVRDRRQFLVLVGETAATVTVAGAGLARVLRASVPGASAAPQPQGLPERPGAIVFARGTRREVTPVEDHYRIDINLLPPSIDGREWALPIGGLVEKPVQLTLSGFERGLYGPAQHLFVTLECISNPLGGDLIGTTRWTGVPLRTVLTALGPKPAARYAAIRSKDGFHETVPLDLAMADPRVMLTYLWDGQSLPRAHGFPLRIYVPDRYGMKQPKWITSIDLVEEDEPGYWVERGWSPTAQVRTTSVIDTVAVDAVYSKEGQSFVPIGGIAYAGARGISRVQVKIDDRPWTDATVGQPLSGLTWVLWRTDWRFEPGSHIFAVRAFDGFGIPQVETEQPSIPEGATGIYRVKKRV